MRRSLLLTCSIALLGLSACSKPTAMTPGISQAELDRERQYQQSQLNNDAVQADYTGTSYSKAQIEQMTPRLERIVNRIAPEATKLCRELNGPQANCNMKVVLSAKGQGVNAHADGKQLVVYPAMIDFAKNDSHLAFVLAHEYTHHMMRHVQSTQTNATAGALLGTLVDAFASSQGVNTGGQIGKLGAQAALLTYSPSFEHEADYIGLYILKRAGYNIDEAPNFWREMAVNNPKGIYTRTTHPTTPERFVTMQKTIQEIKQKEQAGQPLLPNFKPQS